MTGRIDHRRVATACDIQTCRDNPAVSYQDIAQKSLLARSVDDLAALDNNGHSRCAPCEVVEGKFGLDLSVSNRGHHVAPSPS
ncbi:hypothetical protein [Mesorhizobium sp. M1348]|uniref:hypothetical protein n=1 Tax=Mesorhizobium sp. M1348 TaxID=2957089 RepID=UPI0033379B41